jgi:hypothetical protein
MRRILATIAASAAILALSASVAAAGQPAPTTFVVVLNADNEVPHCAQATNAARGVAIFHVVDEATGTVEWRLVANNLPGTPTASHIHIAPAGTPGPVLQPLSVSGENGVVGTGTFTNPTLLAAIRANPSNYYVNVHSDVCPRGVIRGQFGDHGP